MKTRTRASATKISGKGGKKAAPEGRVRAGVSALAKKVVSRVKKLRPAAAGRKEARPELLLAPAKLNLRLKVEGRRFDGYHLLSMLNVKVALFDRLRVALTDDGAVSLQVKPTGDTAYDAVLNDAEKNLAARAASAFLREFKQPWGVAISIEKDIPAGAGLGGGSSDAASVLLWLRGRYLKSNKLPPGGVAAFDEQVSRIALRIGADVPYFLSAGLAHVGGVGEEVTKISMAKLKNVFCLLALPSQKIETQRLYDFYRERTCGWSYEPDYAGRSAVALSVLDYPALLTLIANDLEEAAGEQCPPLKEALARLRTLPQVAAALTGSGSAFFCLARNPREFASAGSKIEKLVRKTLGRDMEVLRLPMLLN